MAVDYRKKLVKIIDLDTGVQLSFNDTADCTALENAREFFTRIHTIRPRLQVFVRGPETPPVWQPLDTTSWT